MSNVMISAIAFIVIIGLTMPFFLSFMIDISDVSVSPLVNPIITLIDDGVDIFTYNFNPFQYLSPSLKDYFVNSIKYFGLLPDFIIAIVFILTIVSVIYGIIKLLPTT